MRYNSEVSTSLYVLHSRYHDDTTISKLYVSAGTVSDPNAC